MKKFFSVKVDDKEVTNPAMWARYFVLTVALVVFVCLIACSIVIGIGVILAALPILIVLFAVPHFILRLAGRRGLFKEKYGTFEVILDKRALEKIKTAK